MTATPPIPTRRRRKRHPLLKLAVDLAPWAGLGYMLLKAVIAFAGG